MAELRAFASAHPRYGYRRAAPALRRRGFRINGKRVYRLWKELGLQVPTKRRQRRHVGSDDGGTVAGRAAKADDVWAYGFLSDQTCDGKSLKIPALADEYTREPPAQHAARSSRGEHIIGLLGGLFEDRGSPAGIRSDNGPEFIAKAVQGYLARRHVSPLFIRPGAPWQNCLAESFSSRLRNELLDREPFGSVLQANVVLEQYRQHDSTTARQHDSHERLHSALGYLAPYENRLQVKASDAGRPPRPPTALSYRMDLRLGAGHLRSSVGAEVWSGTCQQI